MNYVLMAHGAWFQSDGNDKNNSVALYEIPGNLEIRTYNAPGTPMLKETALILLNKLNRGEELNFEIGYNKLEEHSDIEYKVYRKGTQSEIIPNYAIGGDDNFPTGLYKIPNATPIVQMNKDFYSHIKNVIEENRLNAGNNVLHIICCQNFVE